MSSSSQLDIVIDTVTAAGRTFTFNETIKVEGEEPEVTAAYFAEKIIIEKPLDGTYEYTFTKEKTETDSVKKRSEVALKIKNEINAKLIKDKKEVLLSDIQAVINIKETGKNWPLQSYAKGDKISFKKYKTENLEYYKKIDAAPMGYQVYLVAETKKLDGKTVKIKILESKSQNQAGDNILKLVKAEDDVLPVLVFAKLEDKTTTTEASDWVEIDIKKQDQKILGKAEGTEIEVGIKKIQLRPKTDKMASKTEDAVNSFEGWQEALYIREDETVAGKKAIQDAEDAKTIREGEKTEDIILKFDKDAEKKTYPAGKIDAPKTATVGKVIEYILDIDIDNKNYKYKDKATEEDKKNIRWSFYVQGEVKTDKKSTFINAKNKVGLYTYAKTEVVNGKNKLTLVFDKALKGKKVQIEPFRGSPDLSTKPDFVRTTTIKEPETPKITIRDKAHLYLKTQCDSVEKAGKIIDEPFLKGGGFKLETPNTIHIYDDGKMSKLNLEGLKEVKYRYHDNNGDKHNICECVLSEINERLKGVSNDKITAHTVETGYDTSNIITYSHASDRKKYTYPDGTIRTYGEFYNPDKGTKYRLVTYKKGSSKKLLVKMPNSINKKIISKSIIYSFTKTARRYCGPEHLAAFLGALADNGYKIKSGGACEKDGTSYPSVSHINGQSVDTSYLDNTSEQKFIDAMHKFGFGTQLRGKNKKAFNNTSNGGKLHNNHLHSGGLTPNYK